MADASKPVDLEANWSLLYRYETEAQLSKLPVQEFMKYFATQHQIDVNELDVCLKRAQYLANLRKPSNGEFIHRFESQEIPGRGQVRLACPQRIRTKHDWDIARLAGEGLWLILDQELVLRVLRDFAKNAPTKSSGMIFRDPNKPERAQEFLKVLLLMGIPLKDIRLTSFDKTTKKSKHSAAWKKALGLRTAYKVRKRPPPNWRKDWACPWIEIEPVFANSLGMTAASPVLRFVFLMRIILLNTNLV